MRTKQILVHKNEREEIHQLLDRLFENCYIDALTGNFHCKKCKNVVHIDLSRRLVFCSVHGLLV